jgi:hypothetical protein
MATKSSIDKWYGHLSTGQRSRIRRAVGVSDDRYGAVRQQARKYGVRDFYIWRCVMGVAIGSEESVVF